MKLGISIRYKILGVFGTLLLIAVGLYTWLASSLMLQEKTALLFDMNHSLAVNVAAQLRASLLQVSNQVRMQLFSELFAKGGEQLSAKSLQNAHVLSIQLYAKNGAAFSVVPMQLQYPTTALPIGVATPHLAAADRAGFELWSEQGRYFLAMKMDVKTDAANNGSAQNQQTYLAICELDGQAFFEPLRAANLFQSYLTNSSGEVVIHFDRALVTPATPITSHPLLRAALQHGGETSGVLAFDYGGGKWYGAYAPVGIDDLYFLSQASHSEVMSALYALAERSLLFGLIVITVTFMASLLFSKRLTKNLQMLTKSARKIGRGDLNYKIQIRSGDEIQTLANSFNKMIDELKASRDAIEKYNRELEEKVAQRTQELQETNAEIKEVQEKLLKSTQLAAVGEVAGRTAHEVLNPVTAILSRVERARKEGSTLATNLPDQFNEILNAWESDFRSGGIENLIKSLQTPSQIHQNLSLFEEDLINLKTLLKYWRDQQTVVDANFEFIQSETERIHRIIDQMRQLVRASDLKEEGSCHAVLHAAIDTMTDFLTKHGVELHKDLAADEDMAFFNRDEFMQIVTNLVRNAFQAIQAHPDPQRRTQGVIAVGTRNHERELWVEVIDNGVGIPEDKRSYIFDQGFTTKSVTEGTGLGLSICRRYARAFGGDVELVFSESGVGTRFRIRVPLLAKKEMKMAS